MFAQLLGQFVDTADQYWLEMLFIFLEHGLGLCLCVGLIILRNPLVEEGSIWTNSVHSFLQ